MAGFPPLPFYSTSDEGDVPRLFSIIRELQSQIESLRSQLQFQSIRTDRVLSERDALAPELSIHAWNDASPRAFIGTGTALAEGTGITMSRVADTPYISIAADASAISHDSLADVSASDHHSSTSNALSITPESVEISGGPFSLQGDISPSEITADQDDYNPSGLSDATVLRLTSDNSRTITGLQGGADGRQLILVNVGSNDIVLADEDSGSSAANRFALPRGNFTVQPDDGLAIVYDSTSSRWRPQGTISRSLINGPTPIIESTATSKTDPASLTHTVTRASGLVSGELEVCFIGFATLPASVTFPAGWTQFSDQDELVGAYRQADGTETATFNVTTTGGGGQKSAHVHYRISGAALVADQVPDESGAASLNCPSLTMTGNKFFLMLVIGYSQNDLTGLPTNYSNAVSSVVDTLGLSGAEVMVGDRALKAASEDPDSFTGTATDPHTYTIAIHPAEVDVLLGLEDNAGTAVDPATDGRIQITDDGVVNADASGNTIALSIAQAQISHDSIADVSSDDHHTESHTVASHSDTTATGAELETLTDGSNADSLHAHTGGSGSVTTVKEGGAQVGDADIVTLDFGSGFSVSESPDTEVNITLDFSEDAPTHAQVGSVGADDHHAGFIGLEDNAATAITPAADDRIQVTDDGVVNADASGNTIALSVDQAQISHDSISDVSADDHHAQAHTLDSSDHSDVDTLTEATGDILIWNGSAWTNLGVGERMQALVLPHAGVKDPEWGYIENIDGYLEVKRELPSLDDPIDEPGVRAGADEDGKNSRITLEDENGVQWSFKTDADEERFQFLFREEEDPFFEIDDEGRLYLKRGFNSLRDEHGDTIITTQGDLVVGSSDADPEATRLGVGVAGAFIQSDGSDPVYVSFSGDVTVASGGAATVAATHSGSAHHSAVTVSGTPDYITLSGQDIVRGSVDLTADVTGVLPEANLPDASATAQGVVELATIAETDTGTDTTRAVTPDGLQGSKRNIRFLLFTLVASDTDCAADTSIGGDWRIPFDCTLLQDDTNKNYCSAYNDTAGTTGTMVVDVHLNGTTVMTTNKLDIETGEKSTTTAATQPDLTTTDITADDILTFDIDAIHTTAAKGLKVQLAVRMD